MTRKHVVLVGLSGAGKTTVGRLVAERLGAPFIDIDGLIVRQMGRPVEQIFGMLGEAAFRQMEREAVAAARQGAPSVTVPGGGWAAQPGELEAARESSFLVYLKCPVATAAQRVRASEVRPLMMGGPDPVARLRALLEAREPYYTQADCTVAVEGLSPEAVADEVTRLARERAGW